MLRKIGPLPLIEFNSLSEHEEKRDVALVYGAAARDAVRGRLKLRSAWEREAPAPTEANWRALAEQAKGEVVYAVGGGLVVDTAKYVAWARNLPLVSIPTALSVDAFFTTASAARENGCVKCIETKPPERVIIDLEVIAAAPAHLRAAGICDVLSIATARWDWKYADDQEANPPGMGYIEFADQVARAILRGGLECASAAGHGDPSGLKQLVDCLALEVQLCNQLGHSRPEEGSEHYFGYAAEPALGKPVTHAELVGPGIVIMAELQKQDTTLLRRALEACHVPLGAVPEAVVQSTLRALPDFCRQRNLPHGIAHDLTEQSIAKVA